MKPERKNSTDQKVSLLNHPRKKGVVKTFLSCFCMGSQSEMGEGILDKQMQEGYPRAVDDSAKKNVSR